MSGVTLHPFPSTDGRSQTQFFHNVFCRSSARLLHSCFSFALIHRNLVNFFTRKIVQEVMAMRNASPLNLSIIADIMYVINGDLAFNGGRIVRLCRLLYTLLRSIRLHFAAERKQLVTSCQARLQMNFAASRSGSFWSGICHCSLVGRADGGTETLLEIAE